VDCRSLSKASVELGVSQPTLSQQLASLEAHLQRRLLVRSVQGVTVTEAGRLFYRHAQQLEKQLRQTEEEVLRVEDEGGGSVSLGLATCGAASTLALPILRHVLEMHPKLRLRINDNFAGTLSEAIMNGRLDLAVVYGAGPIRGVRFQRLFLEELFLLAPDSLSGAMGGSTGVDIRALQDLPMILPSGIHFLRAVIENACAKAGFAPRVVAEIDSLTELAEALKQAIGVTILPRPAIEEQHASDGLVIRRIGPERIETTVSLCTSAQLPITDAIEAMRRIILSLVQARLCEGVWQGVRPYPT